MIKSKSEKRRYKRIRQDGFFRYDAGNARPSKKFLAKRQKADFRRKVNISKHSIVIICKRNKNCLAACIKTDHNFVKRILIGKIAGNSISERIIAAIRLGNQITVEHSESNFPIRRRIFIVLILKIDRISLGSLYRLKVLCRRNTLFCLLGFKFCRGNSLSLFNKRLLFLLFFKGSSNRRIHFNRIYIIKIVVYNNKIGFHCKYIFFLNNQMADFLHRIIFQKIIVHIIRIL